MSARVSNITHARDPLFRAVRAREGVNRVTPKKGEGGYARGWQTEVAQFVLTDSPDF